MDLLEYQGKQLFARHGLDVSDGRAVTTVEDAVAAANELGYPVVVKAQVLIGGRGKAGGVKLAANEDEAREHATNILGLDIRGHIVHELWIEKASDIEDEYYASILLDRSAKAPLLIFSKEGGVDIEEVAEKTPEKLVRHHIDALDGLSRDEALKIAADGGVDADLADGVADILVSLYEVWTQEDATLTEINPLIVTPDRKVKALDAKVTLDNNALYRHPENAALTVDGAEDPIEEKAQGPGPAVRRARRRHRHPRQRRGARDEHARRRRAGGRRAGELPRRGGGSNAEIDHDRASRSSSPTRASRRSSSTSSAGSPAATRSPAVCSTRSRSSTPTVPFVVRLDGTNDVEGRRLLEEAAIPNVHPAKTMNEAAEKVVALAKERS